MEEDILQQKRDNDRSCLVGVLGAFDCFQLVDNVHILDQEDHNLENDGINNFGIKIEIETDELLIF